MVTSVDCTDCDFWLHAIKTQPVPCNSIQTHKIHFPKHQTHIPNNKKAFGNSKSTVSAIGAFIFSNSQFRELHNSPTCGVGGNDVCEDLEQSFYVGSPPQ